MTVYDKNIELLNEKFSGMGDLFKLALSSSEDDTIITTKEECENEVIIVEKDGKNFYLCGKRDRKSPIEYWINSLGSLMMDAPILIEGVGNSDYLIELVNKTENKVTIFVYEPSLRIFDFFLNSVDLKPLMDKQDIIFWVDGIDGMEEKNLEIMIKNLIRYEVLNMSRVFILPNYDVLFPEKTLTFARLCRDQSQFELVNRNTKVKFSAVVAKNLLANLKHLIKAYKTVQYAGKIPKEVPGIVVAAGPSLNKNIEELKKAKGKAFIIATDTAMKPLLNAGIIPDMYAVVDGKKPLSLINIEGAQDIPLLCTIVAASEVLDYHKGKKIFCNEEIKLADDILNHSKYPNSPIPIGGSVATHIFAFMYMIGIETVILVGQDLAFTNNRSHADGTFKESMPEVDTSRFVMVEGNYEIEVPTSDDFKLYLEWYEKYIAGFQSEDPEFRVINATEGGAKITGTEISTLKEAIEKECTCDVDIQEIIDSIEPMLDEEGQKWASEYVRDIPLKCQKLIGDAKKAKQLYQKLDKVCSRSNIDNKEYLSILKKLNKLLNNIEEQAVYDLVRDALPDAQYILMNEQYLEYGTLQEEGKEIARKGKLYMDTIAECSEIFKNYYGEINTQEQ